MSTKVYGASDDLVEVDGDVHGEVNVDDCLLIFSDGTLLHIMWGGPKRALGIWKITVIHRGTLLKEIAPCEVETDDNYSDVAHFLDGLEWAYSATE